MNRNVWIVKKGVQVGLLVGCTPVAYVIGAAWTLVVFGADMIGNGK